MTSTLAQTPSPAPQASNVGEIRRVTIWGLVVNILLAGLKFGAGIYGNSRAILADGAHSLSDTATDVAILVGSRFWDRPADSSHPYGHRKLETLVVGGLGLSLATVSIGIAYDAILTLRSLLAQGQSEPPSWIALWAALASILIKELLYRWTADAGKRLRSQILIANAWHHRSDSLSSIPAALAIAGARLVPEASFLDPIGALLVALLVLQAAWKVARPAFNKLIDAGAPAKLLEEIEGIVRSVEGVEDMHALRSRYIGCNSLIVDLHILVREDLSVREGHDIARLVRNAIEAAKPQVVDVVVHTEPWQEPASLPR